MNFMRNFTKSPVFTFLMAVVLAVRVVAPAQNQAPPPPPGQPGSPPNPPTAPLSPQQLQQLVAPIALYPGCAGSADPGRSHISHADRRGRAVSGEEPQTEGQGSGQEAVDKQDWDPSVKALTAFPVGALGHEPESVLDLGVGRRQLQPARRRDESHPVLAQAGAKGRPSAKHAPADGDRGQRGCANRARESATWFTCPSTIPSHLRVSGRVVAWILSLVGSGRSVFRVWHWDRHRAVFWIRLGLGTLGPGMGTAPGRGVRRQALVLAFRRFL